MVIKTIEEINEKETKATIVIQKRWRGHKARQRVKKIKEEKASKPKDETEQPPKKKKVLKKKKKPVDPP